ncbi:MAG: carboxymuconolactone decarboxylase family protein [Pirellulaceae bacterium]|nr:carboxymuconolactone decarboxylase family protein [Pirellulaceae bacterium]
MAWIDWIDDSEASGELAEIYATWRGGNPERTGFPEILKCFSSRPDFLRQVMEFSNTVHFTDGHLTRHEKELIATYVSALNQCPY